jgi:hypothetical protein
MGSGMSPFMNMRGMIRAIAPLADLNAEEIQQALAEIEQDGEGAAAEDDVLLHAPRPVGGDRWPGRSLMPKTNSRPGADDGRCADAGRRHVGAQGSGGRVEMVAGVRDSGERTQFGGPEGYLAGIFGGLAKQSRHRLLPSRHAAGP